MNSHEYEPDLLDEIAALRAEREPEAAQNWAAIKLVSDLRSVRVAKGLTQAQVAERMGVSQPHVARIERRPWGTGLARVLAYAQAVGAEIGVRDEGERPVAA